ncbi:MAG: sterol desaturase family protein, partial [Flavobacterium sp.]
LMLTWLTYYFDSENALEKLFIVSFVLITLINCGALLEQRKWIYYLEYARVALLSSYILYSEGYSDLLLLPIFIIAAAEKIFSLGKWYQGYVLQVK